MTKKPWTRPAVGQKNRLPPPPPPEIKGFNGFIVDIPAGGNMDDDNTVLNWRDSISKNFAAAQYRP